MRETRRYQIRGIVQGVGFRPFVFRTASRHALCGWIRNDSDGVVLEVQGPPRALEAFILEVRTSAPALARIDSVALLEQRHDETLLEGFQIHVSERSAQARTLISADTCICDDCLGEMLDPSDRRYRYPFINCTNCGPRYSIIRGVPYDREMTTMSVFAMCAACSAEYHDIADRRFHAQPVACWECGPRVELIDGQGRPLCGGGEGRDRSGDRDDGGWGPGRAAARDAPVAEAVRLLGEGAILAVKGIGGYHLMVDARNERAVAELRRRKRREEKPFALMSPTLAHVQRYAHVREEEARLLQSPSRPIVLVEKGADGLAPGLAPGNRRYGVMLAYTPLHHLLFGDRFDVLVATSGNVSDEPIAFDNDDALARLAQIADAFLINDRDIHTRVDDSIVRVVSLGGEPHTTPLRRARGYTPEPVRAPFAMPELLAVGPELKNTVCLSRGDELFLSHHVGDLKNDATRRSFEHAIDHLRRLLEVRPQLLAHDAHPGYLSTRFAREQDALPTVEVQHHHAHMAACMCEHGLREPVIGVIFDGTGYGIDGNIWGGEFLVGDYGGFERAAHLDYFRLPGGDRAVEEPYRVALALLRQARGTLHEQALPVVQAREQHELRVLDRMIEAGLSSPLTSSMGRLFDGVSALLGVRERCRYEAQAAIELEQLIEPGTSAPPLAWELRTAERPLRIDVRPLVRELADELECVRGMGGPHGKGPRTGDPDGAGTRRDGPVSAGDPGGAHMRREGPASAEHVAELSLRFHCTVVEMVRRTCIEIRRRTGIERAVLSGGVFQNEFLLHGAFMALAQEGFAVHAHRLVPANDGGVALGQAAIAGWRAR